VNGGEWLCDKISSVESGSHQMSKRNTQQSAEKESVEESQPSVAYTPKTPLGKKLLALRERIIAEGLPLLNREEIEKEIADRRGGYQQTL
jgi:hypothetical protein